MKDIHDVITHAKFGDDRLRGSGVVAGQISAFPIDFADFACERVISMFTSLTHNALILSGGRGLRPGWL